MTKEERPEEDPAALRLALAESRREVAALQLSARKRDELLARVAHDLRSPLTVVAINTGVLLKLIPAVESARPARKLVQRIQGAFDLMNHSVDDLLEVASAGSGRVACKVTAFPAAALLEETREIVVALAEDCGLTLDLDIRVPQDALVVCDRTRFQTVVSHLVGTATKLTSGGGHLTIGVEGEDARLRFWVKDSGGAGRAEATSPALRAASSLLEAQGGALSLESGASGGNTYAFTLPRAPEPVATS